MRPMRVILTLIDRIKWRMRMAEKFGMSMEEFRDERTDQGDKKDDLALLLFLSLHRSVQNAEPVATKNDIASVRDGQTTILTKLDEKCDAIGGQIAEGTEATKRVAATVTALLPPRPSDYGCTVDQLAGILGRLGARRKARQIRRWEEFLKTGGAAGTKPPEGYTLRTRLSVGSAAAWAETFAYQEKTKMRTKTSYEALQANRRT